VTKARLEEIQNKPDAKALKAATRAAERSEAVNSAIANGVPREEAENMADELMKTKTKFVNVKMEDGTVKAVEVDDDEDVEEQEEEETLLSPDDSVLILTGANASGKSVFLKSVAIIVYMVR
jgi:cytoskeletal protein RodZ